MRGVSVVFVIVASALAHASQTTLSFDALTVPTANLPAGCTLQAPAVTTAVRSSESGVVKVKADGGPRFPTNPWSGSERSRAAEIFGTIEPSVGASSATVREAYRATYVQADDAPVEVNAVTFENGLVPASLAVHGAVNTQRTPRITQRFVVSGALITVASDSVSRCYAAVRSHLQQLK